MEPHTIIYIIAALVYLYFLSIMIDRMRLLMIRKSRIHVPNADIQEEMSVWVSETREMNKKIKRLRWSSVLFFFCIPTIEVVFHLMVGDYILNEQLLSLTFFGIFFSSLVIILFAVKGRPRATAKKYARNPRIQLD